MFLSKLILWLLFFNITLTEQIPMQCSTSFMTGNDTNLCYYYRNGTLSWMDAYNHCLTRTADGILIQIFTHEQYELVKNTNIDQASVFWLGANNFASFQDSNWHWLDGSVIDDSLITWCPDSTYLTAIGTYCAAYDSTLQCVNSYLCDTLLPAPCISVSSAINPRTKAILAPRLSTYLCSSTAGISMYANWWTYSVLLINWFILFCFFLYLCNRFVLNKTTILLTTSMVILSFVSIIIYAILWGVQYNDIIQIPLAIVIIGSLASAFLFIVLLIILNNRTRVQRFLAVMILLLLAILTECFLFLGVILCTAYCSGYIPLAASAIDKDVTASLLASLCVAITVLFYTGTLHLLDADGNDRVHAARPAANPNNIPLTSPQVIVPPRPPPQATTAPMNNHRPPPVTSVKKVEHIERATSPVDERILNEFYTDRPKDVHQYSLEGRQYVVYEGVNLTDVDSYTKELTQAMLIQEPQGLREAIDRAKSSIHASTLAKEIQQAQQLASKLK